MHWQTNAVTITHIPTGTIVKANYTRSSHKNRVACVEMLKGKLYAPEVHPPRMVRTYEGDAPCLDTGACIDEDAIERSRNKHKE